jgi:hypothetical protein
LFRSAGEIAFWAVFFELADVPFHRFPSCDLSFVLGGETPSHKITAIPLEPAARVFGINPAFFSPEEEGLTCADFEEIAVGVVFIGAELCFFEPLFREFASAIGHILSAEDAEAKHLLRCKLRLKIGVEIPAYGDGKLVTVIFLHLVVDDNDFSFRGFHRCNKNPILKNSGNGMALPHLLISALNVHPIAEGGNF